MKSEATAKGDARAVIEQAWAKIAATDNKRHPNRLPPGFPPFVDYAWKNFDPKVVLAILVDDAASYKGHKPIIFSGLCTWTVCPELAVLRRQGMVLVGIEHLRFAEALGRAAFKGNNLLGDMVGRTLALGQDFYNDFYYPVGGLSSLLKSSSPATFETSVFKRSREAMTVLALMQVFHYHADKLRQTGKHLPGSLEKGAELVQEIWRSRGEKAGVAKDNVKPRWRRLGGSAALIYAASTINVDGGETLLDHICNGTANYDEHAPLLST
ncbi:hypothetical protein [Methylobacterium marchantiae]|uniref:Uncharacterized protein n=1 Tax=Methylobacterium marchantiae TaxID=600331 RepID=A0ABW3WVK9_9HYPH|nr:hypothetical protein AIGOOFII_0324 [Methylobacterium marchantiae]